MVSFKCITIAVILSMLLMAEFIEAAPAAGHKKSRQQAKQKKSINGKNLKANFNKASAKSNAPQQRNPKMNLYNARSWPSTNSFYHAATAPIYLRSAPNAMYYPMRWSNSANYFTSPSMMPTTYLRRSDDYPSMSSAPTMTPSMSSSMMSLGSGGGGGGVGQPPTIIDLSAFNGGSGLLDNTFSSQNLWSMPEMSAPAPPPKSKFNLFNSFSMIDDGLFGGLFNQFK